MKVKTSLSTLILILFLTGCKVDLYTGISQKEGNEMLALLRQEGLSADKEPDKDGKIKLLVEESDVAQAI
ncbi:SctJ family type III secretion inner membrane ring lipoprotein YscJ, partial [Yersinia enterocolitica]